MQQVPILEYDPSRRAIIEPEQRPPSDAVPRACVMCFFRDVLDQLQREGSAEVAAELRSEMGINPVYRVEVDGQAVAAVHPGIGAPLAAGHMEEMIALGARAFTACGGAGVLDPRMEVGHVFVVRRALRDEGTSYHYLPPSREVELDPMAAETLEKVLQKAGVPYSAGKVWTTDAYYRETYGRVQKRRAEGCMMVEMECAAFAAVARFRGVPFGQLLYGGDDVSAETWDSRQWTERSDVREKLFWLAAQGALALER